MPQESIVCGGDWRCAFEIERIVARARRHAWYLLMKKFGRDSLWTRLRCWTTIDFVVIRIKWSYVKNLKKRRPPRPSPYALH